MRKNKIILVGLLFLVLLGTISGLGQAKQRDIYVGDLIELQISGNVAPEQIKEEFSAFEIVDFQQQEDSYQLTVRTFEPGKKVVELGTKKINIEVKSTLDEHKERQKVFAGSLEVKGAPFKWQWKYLIYVIGIIVVGFTSYYIWQWWRTSFKEELSPYQAFKQRLSEAEEATDYFVGLTYALKRYLEATFNRQIIGKTSAEIIAEVEDISVLNDQLAQIEDWLEQVDYYKYTGVEANREEKDKLEAELIELVNQIEEQEEDDSPDS